MRVCIKYVATFDATKEVRRECESLQLISNGCFFQIIRSLSLSFHALPEQLHFPMGKTGRIPYLGPYGACNTMSIGGKMTENRMS